MNTLRAILGRFLVASMIVAIGLEPSSPCRAADSSFTGGPSNNSNTWNTTTNWSLNAVPGTNDVAFFDTAITGSNEILLNANDLGSLGIVVSRVQPTILRASGGNRTPTIGASGITVQANAGAFTIGVDASNSRVSPNLTGSQTWNNNSSGVFTVAAGGGSMTGSNDIQWTLAGSGDFFLDKPMTIAANGTWLWNGTGTLTLNRTNANFIGTMTLNSGTVVVANDLALGGAGGTGPVTIGPSVTILSNSGSRSVANAFTLAGNLTLGGGTALTIGSTGTVNLGSATRTITVQGSTLSIQGVVSNGGITKAGPGLLVLGGANTYTGPTNVTAGTLAISGIQTAANGMITVDSTAALAGVGTTGGGLTFNSGSGIVFGQTGLTVTGTTVFAGSFGIANILGLDGSAADGDYPLLFGGIDPTNLQNVGAGNAFDLGGGKQAFFTTSGPGLSVSVVPEPAVSLAVAAGLAAAAGVGLRGRPRSV